MVFFSFGKKKKRSIRSKKVRKPPAALLKKCRKHHIKTTMKRGGRRVYRKVSILKKLLAKKIRKQHKQRKHRKVSKRKVSKRKTHRGRRSGFGSSDQDAKIGAIMNNFSKLSCSPGSNIYTFTGSMGGGAGCLNTKTMEVTSPKLGKTGSMWSFGRRHKGRKNRFGQEGSTFSNPANFGYNQPVEQYPQSLSQSSMVSNEKMNSSRPEGMALSPDQLSTYGVYHDFFGQDVPTQIPANYNFMGQPDGTLYPVGGPFYRYTTPVSFGKKMYRKTNRSACSRLKKAKCNHSPMCSYVKGRGCRRKSAKKSPGYVMSGDEDLGSYGDEAGISFFGRRRYNVTGSPCNRLRKKVCRSNPNCSYTKRGCRRRTGTKTKGLVFEGPSLAFGKKKAFYY